MRYAPISGNQKWFENQHNEYVVAFKICYDDGGSDIQLDTCYPTKLRQNETILAMRLIIQEPKRWTVEDQKAGRLPEVGSFVFEVTTGTEMEYLGVDVNNLAYLRSKNHHGKVFSCYMENIKPIETLDEKAARLENEFVDSMVKELKVNIGSVSYQIVRSAIRHSYRKLSGELPPVQAKEI